MFNLVRLSKQVSPWRNRLARLTVNQEVGSSSLPGDDFFFYSLFLFFNPALFLPLFQLLSSLFLPLRNRKPRNHFYPWNT
ncbi:hypothetical protein N7462_011411 [Penicillium macrosclerotiorum]|uniref:uncharacterized protein n=1 Tax=Penicillium macrosclerotiorum TaxID=303699 RepID=UPI0025479CA3|nr:uncharacterized protein N7462_011411 [Penicillium macrosclerotiorum]KAJ5664598.1 hypothetical protein N7462_011411 [Penicillium macrosclerotiorum]